MIDQSYRTAIARKEPSVPLRLILNTGFLTPNDAVLDYGCGRGKDVEFLTAAGVRVDGYDLNFQPNIPSTTDYTFVLCSYVLNVIEDPEQRNEVLRRMKAHTKDCPDVPVFLTTVRSKQQVDSLALAGGWTGCGDGYRTPTGTFQHGYTLPELVSLHQSIGFRYLEPVTIHDAVSGVFINSTFC